MIVTFAATAPMPGYDVAPLGASEITSPSVAQASARCTVANGAVARLAVQATPSDPDGATKYLAWTTPFPALSNAPMSQPRVAVTRVWPRWSRFAVAPDAQVAGSPAPMAGLADCSATVFVGPPLSASLSRPGWVAPV